MSRGDAAIRVLVDTSVWIDHLRRRDDLLNHLLTQERVLLHPFVLGELALGSLRRRAEILADLQDLPPITVAQHAEVMRFIEHEHLYEIGLGYVDAHLLAAVRLVPGTSLWTRDRRLAAIAERLLLAARLTH